MRQRDWSTARRQLAELIALRTGHPLEDVARYELAQLALRAGDRGQAVALLEDLLRSDREPALRQPAWLLRCELHLQAQRAPARPPLPGALPRPPIRIPRTTRRRWACWSRRWPRNRPARAPRRSPRNTCSGIPAGPRAEDARRLQARCSSVMRPVIASRRLGLTALVLLGAACSTRVVDLPLGDDRHSRHPRRRRRQHQADTGRSTPAPASPRTRPCPCEMVRRSDGAVCTLCFAPDGTVVNGDLPARPRCRRPPPDAAPAVPVCKIIPRGDLRCRVCSAAAGDYTACLTCQEPVLLGGERCRPCVWSDLPEQRCLQCFGADGGVSHDDCDQFRKEVVAPGGV